MTSRMNIRLKSIWPLLLILLTVFIINLNFNGLKSSIYLSSAYAFSDSYKLCPKCQTKIPGPDADEKIEVNFCPKCGADIKSVAFQFKTDAEKITESVKKRRDELGDLRQLSAMGWFDKGETQEDRITKMACFLNSISISPENIKAQNNLGVLYEEKNMINEAIACFRKAVEIDSTYSKALSNLAKCLADIGKYDDAEAYYKKALQFDEKNPVIHKNYADMLVKLSKYDLAFDEYKKVINLDKDGISARIANWKMDLINKRFKKNETDKK